MVVGTASSFAVFTYKEILVATFAIYLICPDLETVEKCQYIIMVEGWHLYILSCAEDTNGWKTFGSIGEGEKDSYTATAVEVLYLIT